MPAETILEARDLRKTYSASHGALTQSGRRFVAVDGVSFTVARGETLAIVGESGSGKTTVARIALRLIEPDSGTLTFRGEDLLAAKGEELRRLRRGMQMVFQDPMASLNPRMSVGAIVREPLAIHEPQLSRSQRSQRVSEILEAVGVGAAAQARSARRCSNCSRGCSRNSRSR
jgi:ABC-type microcin C transport system duplicated ATPase subunit YejF